MANKNINVLLTLKDKFTKPLKGTTAEVKKQQKQIKAASNVINGWAKNANSKFKSVCGTVGKVGAAFLTLGGAISAAGIKAWSEEAMTAAQAQVEAETKLEAVLGNVKSIAEGGTGAIQAAKKNLMGVASGLQQVGVIGDEVTLAGMQQLATFQLSDKAIATLSTGMTDLLAQQKGLNASQSDAVGVANMIGKAMTGQVTALSRVGITMTDAEKKLMQTGNAEQRAATLAQILKNNVGGVNAALAQTDDGKIQQAKNLYGDMQEEVGKQLTAMKGSLAGLASQYIPDVQNALLSVVGKIQPKVESGIQYLETHKESIRAGIDKVKNAVSMAYKVVSTAVGWCIKHGNVLIPILTGVVAGFAAFSIISQVVAFMTPLITVIKGASAAGGILNAVMAANPFILVAMAIAALVAAGVALWRNWDTVKAKALELWGKVKEVFGGIRDSISGAFTSAKETVSGVVDWITEKIGAIGDAAEKVPVLGTLIRGAKGAYTAVKNVVTRHNATGTPYFSGGRTTINEGGRGEIVDLPNGTRIIPHDVAKKSTGRSIIMNLKLIVQGNVIGNKEFMEQTGEYVTEKVIEALGTV